MSRPARRLLFAGALTVAAGLWCSDAAACATCFGKSDSNLAAGMNMGILTLLFIIGAVLVGVASFFVFLIRRAAVAVSAAPVEATPAPFK